LAKEVIMPKFGFVQEESEILEWLVKEGEKVEKGDPIAVVTTDKISMEVEAPESGVLGGIKYPVGSIVPVTQIIAYILEPGETIPAGDKIETTNVVSEKTLKTEETTEKPAALIQMKISPVAARIIEEKGLDASVIQGTGQGGQITREDVEKYFAGKNITNGKVMATPAARRVAGEKSLDLQGIKGTGPGGRIQSIDVSSQFETVFNQKTAGGQPGILKEIPLIGMRRVIAENMSRSMREAPHMTMQIDVQMDEAEALRKSANEKITDKRLRISATAVIVKAVAMAIKQHPIVNSQFSSEKILVFSDINVGVATALEDGLIVPVIHSADQLRVSEISQKLNDLATRARENKLKAEDLSNGTFTISNLGMFGIDRFTAIINPPESAILAVGAIKKRMVPDDSEEQVIRIKKILTFTLSADHRVMDGAQAAEFLKEFCDLLEEPGLIFKE
jgi:pyruvate dehydrogenase E2 component (dihydrolipoamide acetyltransferase)